MRTSTAIRLEVLTPAYRGLVTIEHMRTVVDLVACGQLERVRMTQHPGHLVPGRNALLFRALEDDADVALWLDSDVAVMRTGPLLRMLELATGAAAIVGAPCLRRGGGFNVVGPRWTRRGIESVDAVGLGCCAYNLAWWRHRRADWPGFSWGLGLSEDYAACEWAVGRGGVVLCDSRVRTWHDGHDSGEVQEA